MSLHPSIYDEFEYTGKWWLAGQNENKVTGTLKFSKKGIRLELIFDQFDNFTTKDLNENIESYIFLGDSSGGLITLIDGYSARSTTRYSTSGILNIVKLDFETLLVGRHFNSITDIQFKECLVHYSNLETWLSYDPLEIISEEENYPKIIVRNIETFEVYVNSLNAKISSTFTIHSKSQRYKQEQLIYIPYIKFTTESHKTLEWFREALWHFRNFLCILTDSKVFIESMIFKNEDESNVRVYTSPSNDYEKMELDIHKDFILALPRIEKNLEVVLNKWYEINIKSSMLLYVNTFTRAENMVLEDIFLGYAKAVESAHRDNKVITNKFVDEDVYLKTTSKMLAVIKEDGSGDLYNKLAATLKYANEFGFQRRIKEVIKSLDRELQEIVLMGMDIKYYADLVRVNRDYNTHFGELDNMLFNPYQFININKSLKLIVLSLILEEINIPNDILLSVLHFNKRWIDSIENGKAVFNIKAK
ncbi:HEPN domain-containing protein [Paenibacillus sp. FSL F4-0125]|uniref:ApeA N-terminal domain 1-containing protein n=1 Tax=Paenibacillus sp. FSL F4-0125 TaxID=2954730 RepID=UPI0030F57A2A